jgi:predicted nucleotidyltransferase component of viral defense system
MSQETPRDMAASVKTRLLQIARNRREELQNVLTRYAIERLLYRLSLSEHRSRFILKGANLFTTWLGAAHRPTRDIDFLGYGNDEIASIAEAFQTICRQPVEDDGLAFSAETVIGSSIRDDEKYSGVRIVLRGMLGKAVIPLQIDIGFGDVITPATLEAEMPTLLNFPKPKLLTYPRETVIAEKCEAMLDLGMANTRLKDFYDLWHLATHFTFEGPLLCRAIAATLERRETAIPTLPPVALTSGFYTDEVKRNQWRAFIGKSALSDSKDFTLEQCIEVLEAFLLPPLRAIQNQSDFEVVWNLEDLRWQPSRLALAAQQIEDE